VLSQTAGGAGVVSLGGEAAAVPSPPSSAAAEVPAGTKKQSKGKAEKAEAAGAEGDQLDAEADEEEARQEAMAARERAAQVCVPFTRVLARGSPLDQTAVLWPADAEMKVETVTTARTAHQSSWLPRLAPALPHGVPHVNAMEARGWVEERKRSAAGRWQDDNCSCCRMC
jgi:hypothetical protein